MIKALRFYLKGKQIFSKGKATYRLVGSPIPLIKKKIKQGFEVFHIKDLDALKGNAANLDIYDHLTQFTHVQVECLEKETLVKKLLGLRVRVVLDLPIKKIYQQEYEKLIVGKAEPGYKGPLNCHDVFLDGEDGELVKRIKKENKRLIINKEENKTDAFIVIEDL
ncbi:hypothetical protein KAW38_05345 [Candidatus Micrarchaeota archaeon]|nr:hypothetical protein [Candidatus Micrarchaeota archaeon]